MKLRVLLSLMIYFQMNGCHYISNNNLFMLEQDVKKSFQQFNDLTTKINVNSLAESMMCQDVDQLKKALDDINEINGSVTTTMNVSISFWNMYIDSVKIPSMETYLMGQVLNALMSTIRALSLRTSIDQAMILNLVRKFELEKQKPTIDVCTCEIPEVSIENRWKSLKIN